MHPRTRITLAAAAALLAAHGLARADDVALAKTLFEQGVADLEAKRFEKACPAIEQSFRLDPRPGTLFTLAECEAQRGRLATAVARYTEFLALHRNFAPQKRAEQKERADISTAQIAALGPHVPALTLRLPEGAPADVVVTRNGNVVPGPSIGTALAVDPGEHLVTVQVPGSPLVEHRISLQKGERRVLELSLERRAAPSPPDPAPPSSASAAVSAAPSASASASASAASVPAPPDDARPFRAGALAAGGVGVAGLAVGIAAGLLALDRKAAVDRDCTRTPGGFACATQAGVTAGNELKDLGAVSTTGFVVGAVGLAAGALLLVTMPSAQRSSSSSRPPSGAPETPSLGLSVSFGGAGVWGSF